MKRFALWVFYSLLGLFLIFIAGGYALPGRFHMERQIVVNAPADKIFAIVSDLNRAKDWSPWMGLDPQMTLTIEGPAGLGQKMSWVSKDPNVGSGTQTTSEFVANEKVVSALDFGEMGKADATVLLAPEGAGTKVTWTFDSSLNSMLERWFGLILERMIGPDFEKGLATLKAFAEKP